VKLRGWRTCAASHNTTDLLLKHFDFEWDASLWNDDLPYVIEGFGKRLLEIPFSSYSDAALAIQITHPMPPTPSTLSIAPMSSRATATTSRAKILHWPPCPPSLGSPALTMGWSIPGLCWAPAGFG
jgi:hypothetical protein